MALPKYLSWTGHGSSCGEPPGVFTGATIQNATNCQLQMAGLLPTKTFTLQVSSNLLNWWDVTNFMACSNGVFQCVDPIPGDGQLRFYRLKSGTP